jgi:hypothetical protein
MSGPADRAYEAMTLSGPGRVGQTVAGRAGAAGLRVERQWAGDVDASWP